MQNVQKTKTVTTTTTTTVAGASGSRRLLVTGSTNVTTVTGIFTLTLKETNATCPTGSTMLTNTSDQNITRAPRCWDAYETHMYFPGHKTLPPNAGCSKFLAQSLTVNLNFS